jgi:serine/threonine protein kinase
LRDRYVLHDEIGRGGAGTVYLAFDRNRAGLPHEQQFVALKVLRQEHARRPETLHALRREFHQAQSLSHPGIVNVFDFDHEGETYFVTMELLNGEPLGVLMRHALPHTLDRELATRILRELGDAIAYAHERDVLHLDLKPGNVMVVDGHVRVLDFGLAQTFMAEPWISEMPLPRAATPAYASCERLLGDLPDVRDDIFSYACLAYELLSGQHPFDRGSALEAQSAGHKPRRIRGLSHGQWRALKRGLAWSRADRSEGMQELIDGLALPVATSRHGVRRRAQARTSVAAPRWSVAALALLVLGVVAVLGWNFLPRELRASVVDQAAVTGSILGDTAETVRDRVVALSTTPADHLEPRASPAPSATPQAPPSEQGVPLSAPPPMSDPVVSNIQPPVVESPPVQIPAVETPAVASTAQPTRPTSAIADPPAEAAVSTAADTAVSTIPDRSAGGPGAVEFASDTVTVSESNSTARVKVRRRGGAAGEISFVWRTLDDTALAGEDYASGEVRETMASGQTTATLLIPIVGDSIAEHTELLDVVLDDTSGAELGSLTRASVIIVDDD